MGADGVGLLPPPSTVFAVLARGLARAGPEYPFSELSSTSR